MKRPASWAHSSSSSVRHGESTPPKRAANSGKVLIGSAIACDELTTFGERGHWLQYPGLHSFAKRTDLSVARAKNSASFSEFFNIPVSKVAFLRTQQLARRNSLMTFIWGSITFSSSKTSKVLIGHGTIHPAFKWLWKTSCQCKHRVFFWLLLKDRLSTRNMLRSKNLKLENLNRVLCPGNAEETAQHLFQDCTFAKTKPVGGILNFNFQTNQPLPLLIEGFKQHFFAPFFLEIFILIVLEYLGSEKRPNFQRRTSIFKQLQKSLH